MSKPHAGFVRAARSAPSKTVSAGSRTEMQVLLGPEQGAPNFVMRRFVMREGGGIPRHSNQVEHEQYVLRGRARVVIGESTHEVGPNDTLYIPAGTPHSYEVTDGPFEFLCVVPNAPDEIRMVPVDG